MPDDEASRGSTPGRSVPLHRRLAYALFGGLVVLAAVFYVGWGLQYGTWLDNGVYAVTIVLLLFGVSGMWLVAPTPAPGNAPRDAAP